MGLFNTIKALEKAGCDRCTQPDWVLQFKYGLLGCGYRLGNKLQWLGGKNIGVPDTRLRYVSLSGGQCPVCGTPAGDILIIRNNVLDAIYAFPDFSRLDRQGMGMVTPVKGWELMLLLNEFGLERVATVSRKIANEVSGGRWEEFAGKIMEDFKRFMKEQGESPKTKPGEFVEWAQSKLVTMAMLKTRMRDLLLNELRGMREFDQASRTNFITHQFACPSCGKTARVLVPFRYGPCNDYVFEVGNRIDWTKPGHIPDVRDPELHYVEVFLPACKHCGYEGAGMITVEEDRISDIFIWRKDVLDTLNVPINGAIAFKALDAFLYAREFTPDVFKKELERIRDRSSKNEAAGDFLHSIAERARQEIDWSGFK